MPADRAATLLAPGWRDMASAPEKGTFLVYLEEERGGSRVHTMRRRGRAALHERLKGTK